MLGGEGYVTTFTYKTWKVTIAHILSKFQGSKCTKIFKGSRSSIHSAIFLNLNNVSNNVYVCNNLGKSIIW